MPPVDDQDRAGRPNQESRRCQQSDRFFTVQDVEKQASVGRALSLPKTLSQDVPLKAHDIVQPCLVYALACSSHHLRVEVDGRYRPRNPPRHGDCESAISAAKLDGIFELA